VPRPVLVAGHLERVDAPSGQATQGRQKGQRDGHGDDHGSCRAQPQIRDERDAGDGQAQDRDHHGRAGEQHRRARRRVRHPGRVDWIATAGQLLAESGDEKQRVVNPDAQADGASP